MAGMLWVWVVPSQWDNKYLTPLLKETKLDFRYVDYKEGVLPFFNISQNDVILALGSEPLQELKNYGLVKKNLTIGSSGKTPYTLPCGAKCLTSYSPWIRNVDYSLFIGLQGDVKLAARLALTGTTRPPLLNFQWVPNFTAQLNTISDIRKTRASIAITLDLETTGLVAYSPETWIVTCQISLDTESSYVIKFDKDFQPRKPTNGITCREELVWEQINTLLNDSFIKLRGANLKYDLMWIFEKWGITCTNFSMDTLLVGSLLDENRSNSLKTHASLYTIYGDYEQELYTKYDIAKPHEVPDDVLLPYCGYDTTVCLEVSQKMIQELHKNPTLARFYNEILHPAARAYERVERVGILVDTNYYQIPNESINIDGCVAEAMCISPEEEKAAIAKYGRDEYDKQRSALRKAAIQEAEIHKYSLKGFFEKKLAELAYEGSTLISGRIKCKYLDNPSLTRAAMLGDLFFNHADGFKLTPVMFTPKPDKKTQLPKASTALEHFLKFKDYTPEIKAKKLTKHNLEKLEKAKQVKAFVGIIEKYKDIEKTLGTYVTGFLKHLRYDNKFHGTYFLFKGGDNDNGTDTGRVSVVDPALQTVPKNTKWAKPLRRAFIAPPDYYILELDYSQGELRIAADLANEPKMLWAYNNGIDLHAVTGASLAGIDLDLFMSYKDADDPKLVKIFKSNRQKAKGANFGLLYGMGAEGFRTYAETAYGVKMTITEAEEAREKFFDTYKGLLPWHERCKDEARRMGYVVSPLGRIRHLPQIRSPDNMTRSKEERRSVNSRVQGTLSDMSLWATSIMEKEGHTEKAPVILMVHDALYFYIPKDDYLFYIKKYKEIMETLPFGRLSWEPKVKFEVDGTISMGNSAKGIPPNFADLQDFKNAGIIL